MDSNIKDQLITKDIYTNKSIFSIISKVIIPNIIVAIYAFTKILFSGFNYRNGMLIAGAILSIAAVIVYGLITSSDKVKKTGLSKILLSFSGFFPNIFGFYLIFYEFIRTIKLLLKEFSLQTSLAGLLFITAGLIILNAINKTKKTQIIIDEKDCSVNKYLGFLLVLFALPRLIGGMSFLGNSFRLEVPFVLFWYWFFCSIQRRNRFRPYLAAVPIILAYTLFDLYFIAFGKIFKVVDIQEIPELIEVLPLSYTAIGVMLILIPVGVYLFFIDLKKYRQILTGVIIIFFLGFTIKNTPETFLNCFNSVAKGATEWSDKKSVEDNGRFMMIFYSEAKRNVAIKQTTLFRNRDEYDKDIRKLTNYLKLKSKQKNIHLIVLESFLDPTLFTGLKFSKDPIYPEFSSFFYGKEGFSISPIFGGKTAQAEFEILCGIPAFNSLDSIEFNLFTGADAYGLPGILREIGYRTIASNTYKPDFFNLIPAYKSIGFSEIYFPVENVPGADTYLSVGDISGENIMFDSTLLEQNIKFISNIIQNTPNQPVFNYILGQYGHYPFEINENKRPKIIKVISKIGGEELQRQVNQFYYRTEAIIKFVKELIKIDPGSIIILVSDHLPFFVNPDDYRLLNYLDNIEDANKYNRIYVVENGKPVKYEVIFHHDIPNLILNYITDGHYLPDNHYEFGLRTIDKAKYYEKYMKFVAHAIK